MSSAERAVLVELSSQSAARDEVLRLATDLDVSALKLEVMHFAMLMGWTSERELRRVAVESTKTLLARPLSSESVDIVCEITKHERLGDAIKSEDLPPPLFQNAEGIRLVDCVNPTDRRVTPRLAAGLSEVDPLVRLWAAYALSHRLPLPQDVMLKLRRRADDSPEMRERVRWIVAKDRRMPPAERYKAEAGASDRGRYRRPEP
jgi:hypothetical protein